MSESNLPENLFEQNDVCGRELDIVQQVEVLAQLFVVDLVDQVDARQISVLCLLTKQEQSKLTIEISVMTAWTLHEG